MEPLHPAAQNLTPLPGGLASYPPVERWEDWTEYDPQAWPKRVERRYQLLPTICFNCEAACGLLAYVDKQKLTIQKFEGNPEHPGSRGRNCAKGPATLNQVEDPERIRYPMKRIGPRGGGQWQRVSWGEVLDDIAARVRKALVEGRKNEVMYHVGRPGHELVYHQRIMHAWGIDGHNSHTNVCSASARAGYAFWSGLDRPSPDHANARFILLLSSHLETGHYFNPHAQRIIEGKKRGAKVCAIDTRLSNTASMADWWLSPWPGTEAAMLLAMCQLIIAERRYDREFLRRWVNWAEYLREEHPDKPQTFETFEAILPTLYQDFTLANHSTTLCFRTHGGGVFTPGDFQTRNVASVRLYHRNEIVRESFGWNSDAYQDVRWDIREFAGESLRLMIADDATGPWGFIDATNLHLAGDDCAPARQ